MLEVTDDRRGPGAGDVQVIEPEVSHHVELGPSARFVVEFYQ